MANYVYNFWKFDNLVDFNKVKTLVPVNDDLDSLDFNFILTKPSGKVLLKEIMDAELDDHSLSFYCENYTPETIWKKIYWGTAHTSSVEIDEINLLISFTSPWTAPVGIVKELMYDMQVKFNAYTVDEGDMWDGDGNLVVETYNYDPRTVTMETKKLTDLSNLGFDIKKYFN